MSELSQPTLNLREFPRSHVDDVLLHIARWCAIACGFFLPISVAIANGFFVATSVLCLLRRSGRDVVDVVNHHPVAWTFLAYFGLLTVGLSYTSAPWSEALGMYTKYNKLLLAVPLFALSYDRRVMRSVVGAFVASMTLTMVLGYAKIAGLIHIGEAMGSASIFTRHITTNWYMAIASYFVLIHFLEQPKARWFAGLLVALMGIYIVFLNEGRTGYITLVACWSYAIWWRFRWRGMVAALVMLPVLFVSAYLTSPHFRSRVDLMHQNTVAYHAGDTQANSMSMRFRFLQNGFKIVSAHPLLGTGTGSVATEMRRIESDPAYHTRNPHNEFMNQWIQLGTLGLLAWCGFLAWQWRSSRRYTPQRTLLVRGVILALIAGSTANSLLMDSLEGHLYVFFTALIMAA